MAINIEVKQRFKALEDRLKALEERLEKPEPALSWEVETPKDQVKLCPKCNKKPAHHLHVRACKGP